MRTSFDSVLLLPLERRKHTDMHAHAYAHACPHVRVHTHLHPAHSVSFFSLPGTPLAAIWDNLAPWSRLLLVPSSLIVLGICGPDTCPLQPSCLRPALLTKESVSTKPLSVSHVVIRKPLVYSSSLVYLPSPQKYLVGVTSCNQMWVPCRKVSSRLYFDEAVAGADRHFETSTDHKNAGQGLPPATVTRFQRRGTHESQASGEVKRMNPWCQ